MADLERVRRWAEALIVLHLDPRVWSFGFDNAKKRAGLCRRGFDRANLIVWRHREITTAVRRRAASAAGG